MLLPIGPKGIKIIWFRGRSLKVALRALIQANFKIIKRSQDFGNQILPLFGINYD